MPASTSDRAVRTSRYFSTPRRLSCEHGLAQLFDWKNRRRSPRRLLPQQLSFVRPTPAAAGPTRRRNGRPSLPTILRSSSVADDFSDRSSFETLVASDGVVVVVIVVFSRVVPVLALGEVVCPSTSSPSSSSRTANSSSARDHVRGRPPPRPAVLVRSSSPTANAASSSCDRRSLEGSRLRFCGESWGARVSRMIRERGRAGGTEVSESR